MAKILAVSHDAELYGAQRCLFDAVVGLMDAGHDVEVCVPQGGPLVGLLAARGIRVHVVPFARWLPPAAGSAVLAWLRFCLRFPLGVLRASRLLRSGGFDVVYTNTVTVLDFAVAARLRRLPHVWHLHEIAAGNPQLRSPLDNRRILAIVRGLSTRIVYNSRFLAARYGAGAAGKDRIVYNGLPARPARPARQGRIAGDRIVVLTAGFMARGKGLDVLLDALAQLPRDLSDRIVLRVAGHLDPGYAAREITPRLARVRNPVEFLGWVDDMDAALAAADLLVSSARQESFGRTLVEAMMAGVPVLATRSGGPQEIVVDGVTGLLVPPEDPPRLGAALAGLLREPQRLQAYGEAGRAHALAQFSLPAYVRAIEDCLLDAISSAAAAPVLER